MLLSLEARTKADLKVNLSQKFPGQLGQLQIRDLGLGPSFSLLFESSGTGSQMAISGH
jgi:hypothetical protein